MKVNYDNILTDIINKLDHKPSLLLHSCCGPCSSYVINYLKDYFDITVLYYNPNIEPTDEYNLRKSEQLRLLKELDIKFLDSNYDNDYFHKEVLGYENCPEGGERCHICYKLRLNKTLELGLINNFEYIGTTLTVSPYKNAYILNSIGEYLVKDKNILWLYSDFKKKDGYKKSIELSKKYNLYRQDYCGCLYSKGNN